jgi:4'-phosphopantetheinyl transferase
VSPTARVVVTAVAGRHDDPMLLTAAETARHARLVRPEDRAAYLAAHTVVRECAADVLGLDARAMEIAQRCGDCGAGDHGAPYVVGHPDLHVSLSHTRVVVAAMVDRHPCGIDVEEVVDSVPWAALSVRERTWAQAQPEPELAFTRLWVRKEALVKAGVGRLADAAALDVLGEEVLGEEGPAVAVVGHDLVEGMLAEDATRPRTFVWCGASRRG